MVLAGTAFPCFGVPWRKLGLEKPREWLPSVSEAAESIAGAGSDVGVVDREKFRFRILLVFGSDPRRELVYGVEVG